MHLVARNHPFHPLGSIQKASRQPFKAIPTDKSCQLERQAAWMIVDHLQGRGACFWLKMDLVLFFAGSVETGGLIFCFSSKPSCQGPKQTWLWSWRVFSISETGNDIVTPSKPFLKVLCYCGAAENTCITDCWWHWWPLLCFQWMDACTFLSKPPAAEKPKERATIQSCRYLNQ